MKGRIQVQYLKSITELDFRDACLAESVNTLRARVMDGHVYILKNCVSPSLISKLKEYLSRVGANSLPNYEQIKVGAPNSHRINYWDERAFVKGCFHQFNFYPWNQDIFNLFHRFLDIYKIRNRVNGLAADQYLRWNPSATVVPRLCFQFYPRAVGSLNAHIDPIDTHQLCVPSLVMSEFGVDFTSGGLFLESSKTSRIAVEQRASVGDVILFNAQIPHGVETIDEHADEDWSSFRGRWMMLFAMNKVTANNRIDDSLEV